MKTCACCNTTTEDATCPNCGEASWLADSGDDAPPSSKPKTRAERKAAAKAKKKSAAADSGDDAPPSSKPDDAPETQDEAPPEADADNNTTAAPDGADENKGN